MIDEYPVLKLIVRFGSTAAPILALAAAALIGGATWPVLGWLGLLLGIFAGVVLLIVGLAFVELVKLITNMLLPQ